MRYNVKQGYFILYNLNWYFLKYTNSFVNSMESIFHKLWCNNKKNISIIETELELHDHFTSEATVHKLQAAGTVSGDSTQTITIVIDEEDLNAIKKTDSICHSKTSPTVNTAPDTRSKLGSGRAWVTSGNRSQCVARKAAASTSLPACTRQLRNEAPVAAQLGCELGTTSPKASSITSPRRCATRSRERQNPS